jgi:hypothetical protein
MCRFNTAANNHDNNFSGRNMHVFHIFITEKHSVTPYGDNSVFLKKHQMVMLDHQTTSCSLICIYIAVTASKKYILYRKKSSNLTIVPKVKYIYKSMQQEEIYIYKVWIVSYRGNISNVIVCAFE